MIEDERNIEIKARVIGGKSAFERHLNVAKNLNEISYKLLEQRDVFFNSPLGGRLKLRYFSENTSAQLIYYNRPDQAGPKLSTYNKCEVVKDPGLLEKILTQTNGAIGAVLKERHLFLFPNGTRIHMDNVQNLGYFIEFEVCLKPEQTIEEGQEIAEELMRIFRIHESDLIQGAYFDELQNALAGKGTATSKAPATTTTAAATT